jgi:hypothetical protein
MTTDARPEIASPDTYKRRVIALLGGRAPLDVLAETPGHLEGAVSGEDPGVLRARPFAGKWTPLEIVGHYVDTEWAFGWRTRAILGDDSPRIAGFDQDKWVAAQRHNDADPTALVGAFRSLRAINLALWRGLPPAALARTAIHEKRGEESLGLWLELIAGHDLWHLDQLGRYLAAAR